MTITSQGSSSGVPVGTVIWYAASTPPTGWLICNGQSTAGYTALAIVVGSNVPDLRGEFIRGLDLGRGVDSGRSIRSAQGDAIRNIRGTFDGNINDGGASKTGVFYDTGISFNGSDGDKGGGVIGFDASRVVPTANENRPRNIALLPCIKY